MEQQKGGTPTDPQNGSLSSRVHQTGLLGAPPPAAFLQGMIGQWGAQINRPKGAEWGGTRP